MIEAIWESIGFIRWPLAFSMVWVVGLSLFSAVRLAGWNARPDHRTKAWVDAILFWGGFAVIAGTLGTVVGIILAAQSVEAAGAVSTTLLWGGIKVAMLSSAVGVLVLATSSLSWFVLQLRWRLLRATLEEEAA